MPATPEQPRKAGPQDATIETNCAVCGLRDLVLHPVAVTVNLPAGVVQTTCGHCGKVTNRPVPPRKMLVALYAAGADKVPQGIDDETKAHILGRDVYGDEPVPQWPAGGAA